jgi:hypothetical protein
MRILDQTRSPALFGRCFRDGRGSAATVTCADRGPSGRVHAGQVHPAPRVHPVPQVRQVQVVAEVPQVRPGEVQAHRAAEVRRGPIPVRPVRAEAVRQVPNPVPNGGRDEG